jgi:hypothetical protein
LSEGVFVDYRFERGKLIRRKRSALIAVKEESGFPKDVAVLPVPAASAHTAFRAGASSVRGRVLYSTRQKREPSCALSIGRIQKNSRVNDDVLYHTLQAKTGRDVLTVK